VNDTDKNQSHRARRGRQAADLQNASKHSLGFTGKSTRAVRGIGASGPVEHLALRSAEGPGSSITRACRLTSSTLAVWRSAAPINH
jgi:hypothetical protein